MPIILVIDVEVAEPGAQGQPLLPTHKSESSLGHQSVSKAKHPKDPTTTHRMVLLEGLGLSTPPFLCNLSPRQAPDSCFSHVHEEGRW